MREQLLAAVKAHAQGEIAKHRANVNVYLEHPAGIGEHSDITEAIQTELDKIARYHDQVEVIEKYFKQKCIEKYTIGCIYRVCVLALTHRSSHKGRK